MVKFAAAALVATLLINVGAAAEAASTKTIQLGNSVSITYPVKVKLKKTGCQTFSIAYRVGDIGDSEFVLASVFNGAGLPITGQTVYQTPSMAEINGHSPYANAGKVALKLCRNAWSRDVGWGRTQNYKAASKGLMQLVVATSAETVKGSISFF